MLQGVNEFPSRCNDLKKNHALVLNSTTRSSSDLIILLTKYTARKLFIIRVNVKTVNFKTCSLY